MWKYGLTDQITCQNQLLLPSEFDESLTVPMLKITHCSFNILNAPANWPFTTLALYGQLFLEILCLTVPRGFLGKNFLLYDLILMFLEGLYKTPGKLRTQTIYCVVTFHLCFFN